MIGLFNDADIRPFDQQQSDDSYDRYGKTCQTNIEVALSALPLCFRATHDMVLALALAVLRPILPPHCLRLISNDQTIYAVDISMPALAWVYVSAAQQSSYSLGFHTRSRGADDGSDVPNKAGLLFWTIYCLEKNLSLRLGRCSTILDIEITVPLPASSAKSGDPEVSYGRQMVRLASLAGRTYEGLYCADALTQPDETRKGRVLELSQELSDIRTKIGLATVSSVAILFVHTCAIC